MSVPSYGDPDGHSKIRPQFIRKICFNVLCLICFKLNYNFVGRLF